MLQEQKDALEKVFWRLLNNAVNFQNEPENYVPIRLLDGVIGILEILAEEDVSYKELLSQVALAKEFAVDDTDEMVRLLSDLIMKKVRSRQSGGEL